jgi:hypothetical protein
MEFIAACMAIIRQELPGVVIEARLDSALFNDDMVTMLNDEKVKFTISVPFERFPELKKMTFLADAPLFVIITVNSYPYCCGINRSNWSGSLLMILLF